MGRLPSEGFLQVEEKSKIVESEGDVTMKKKKNAMLALKMEKGQGIWAAP